jgi:hypothetical protein
MQSSLWEARLLTLDLPSHSSLQITADAVAHLIAHIVEQAGPHPIGEIGKLLQEATGNPSKWQSRCCRLTLLDLSRVLKSQFRGLKKLIEGYPHMLRLGGDHSFNPHVYLADKSCSSNNSEFYVDALMDAMTDRDSDDLLSPQGSFSASMKKHLPFNGQQNGNGRSPSAPPDPQPGSQQYHQLFLSRSELAKPRGNIVPPSNSWQDPSRANMYTGPAALPRTGSGRLHVDAGEFEPGRGLVDYIPNSSLNVKQRLDGYAGVDLNRNQSAASNIMSQPYGYRPKLTQQQTQYDQTYYSSAPNRATGGSRSQNLATHQPPRGGQSNRASVQSTSRYDLQAEPSYCDPPNRAIYGLSNRFSYGGYPVGHESWERNSHTQYDPEVPHPSAPFSSANAPPHPRVSQGNARPYPLNYEVEPHARARPTLLSNGRLALVENSEMGLEFDADRSSFLFPNDYDPSNQSYSLSDHNLLKDAAFANNLTLPLSMQFGHEEGNGLLAHRFGNAELPEDSYGDSKMLAYFLKESDK